MEPEPDSAVVAASMSQPAAFGVLFDRHAGLVYRYLARRVGTNEAQALLGETFRIAFERRAAFDPTYESARPWLYGIATRLVAGHRRGEARRLRATARLRSGHQGGEDQTEAVDRRLDAAARWPSVAEAITRLPTGERDALILHVWEGFSYDEVAESLQVPVGTVRSRLNRARRHLRELTESTGQQLQNSANPSSSAPSRPKGPTP
jgi:RNA polymerase sigma factor (sigma-70 family)